MKVFSLENDLYHIEPLFIIDATPEQLRRYLLKHFDVTVSAPLEQMAGAVFTFAVTPWRVVWTRHLEIGTVLHEVFHLITSICGDKQIPIRAYLNTGENGDEAAAYLFEFFRDACPPKDWCATRMIAMTEVWMNGGWVEIDDPTMQELAMCIAFPEHVHPRRHQEIRAWKTQQARYNVTDFDRALALKAGISL